MTKPPRYFFRLVNAFLIRFRLIFLVGIFLGVVGFVFFRTFTASLPQEVKKIGVVGEYNTDNLPFFITNLISKGLTVVDESGKVTPGMAEKWEIEDEGKTWIFHLKKNVKWQDGTEVVTKDINYNFSDASVEKPDQDTLIFKLKTALAPFPVTLSKPIFKKGLLGVGEWKVVNLSLAGTFIETLTLGDPDNKQKIFKFYPTEERAKLAYQLGEINELGFLVHPEPFNTWQVADVSGEVDKQKYAAVFYNTSDSLLVDKDIRQALTYAIEKDQFGENRAFGPLSPNSWAYNPSLKPYDFDLEHARQLIKSSGISEEEKKNLKVTLTTLPDLLPVAEVVGKNWREIGVETTLQVTSFTPTDYQAFLAIYNIPTDPDQYLMWHSTQTPTNITKYKNARIDKLLEEGRLETNEEKRKQYYFDFQRFLVEDSPAAFLYYPTYYTVTRR